jgi:hypothetical protein
MCVCTAGTHLGGDPNRFHDLLRRRSLLKGGAGMPANAIRALCHVRHRYGNQLFRFHRECPIGKHTLTERFEGLGGFGGQALALLGEFPGRRLVDLFLLGHDSKLLS